MVSNQSVIKKSFRKLVIVLSKTGLLNTLSDKAYLKAYFWAKLGYKLNLKQPVTYNEKLQWLKIHDRKEAYIHQVDKYEVRKLIADELSEDYLVPMIALYDTIEEINWSELPDKFVMKATHGSGSNIICSNKADLNIEDAERQLKWWMKRNWYWFGRAYPYKHIKPRIIVEEYLEDDITDYKFMCFNGEPKLVQVHMGRHGDEKSIDFYDMDWKKTTIGRPHENHGPTIPKPQFFDEMKSIAEQLSADNYHVRIDLYEVNNKVYFGEKTFYSASGFAPFNSIEEDIYLGSLIDLPI
ncbi:Glycosyltransferase [Alkalibacterium sp. AK22]|uniref:ATP-grasp fold amidoligase family protein n=1 Tax=Alkalibacterium sp. AK22 TaxID=1229520 RepID=UPI00045116D6|nr:ATP-grasp fold amidoligase family protein [Alkalibacterium sp. AK22]EXJ23304.1 Glycosyltransferase [Alkalibacterium sp. AK22]